MVINTPTYAEPRWRIETPRCSSRDIVVSNPGNYKRLLVVSCFAPKPGASATILDHRGLLRLRLTLMALVVCCVFVRTSCNLAPGAVGAGEEMRDAEFSYGMLGPTPYCIRSPLAPSLSFALEPEGSFREGNLVVYIG